MRVRLHWLPFPQRIKFKLCSTVYKCLHDAAPAYLSEFCIPLSSQAGHSQLRSAAAGDLLIPPTRTVTIGGRGFSVAGPVAWNSLPTDLKDGTLTFPVFKKLLKTHLFVTIWTAALRLCGDCMKGALQVPVSIQFNSLTVRGQLRSNIFIPFESPYVTSYLTSMDTISLSCTVFEKMPVKISKAKQNGRIWPFKGQGPDSIFFLYRKGTSSHQMASFEILSILKSVQLFELYPRQRA